MDLVSENKHWENLSKPQKNPGGAPWKREPDSVSADMFWAYL